MAHCRQHELGSPGLRACMRNIGANLNRACIGALVNSGEIGASAPQHKQKKAERR